MKTFFKHILTQVAKTTRFLEQRIQSMPTRMGTTLRLGKSWHDETFSELFFNVFFFRKNVGFLKYSTLFDDLMYTGAEPVWGADFKSNQEMINWNMTCILTEDVLDIFLSDFVEIFRVALWPFCMLRPGFESVIQTSTRSRKPAHG